MYKERLILGLTMVSSRRFVPLFFAVYLKLCIFIIYVKKQLGAAFLKCLINGIGIFRDIERIVLIDVIIKHNAI